jgi:hypothetical protein
MPLVTTASWAALNRGNPDPDAEEGLLQVQSADLTWSWGAQPASAEVTYTAQLTAGQDIRTALAPVPVGSYLELQLGPYTFFGLCQRDDAVQSSGGKVRKLQFRDLREFLEWDEVFCAFNVPVTRMVQFGHGLRRVRTFRSLYPADWGNRRWTEHTSPLTGTQILNALFAAPTVGSPWAWTGPAILNTVRPLDLNFEGGAKLGAALLAVAERVGLQFTLGWKYLLKFRRKGVLEAGETFPVNGAGNYIYPAGADNCEQGLAVSGQPTRIYVVGDRNLYQVNNLVLEPDWNSLWSQWWDPVFLLREIYLNHTPAVGGDVEDQQRWANAEARLAALTVRDVAALKGTAYGDNRRFGGRSRMDMPAVGYINELVFRAWRVPASIIGRPAAELELVNTALAAVTHDASGVMSVLTDQELGIPESESGPGYVIAQGIGVNEHAFRALNPRNFNLSHWVTANTRWGSVGFQVDPDGGDGRGFIVAETKLYRPDNLLVVPAATPQLAVLNANFTPTVPEVRASLTFAGELYRRTVAAAWDWSRDATVTENGLHLERVVNAGGSLITTIEYLDGQTANQKADTVANSLLARQAVVTSGGYERLLQDGDGGVILNGCYDRITVRVSRATGLRERIDFTNERTWSTFLPERVHDRNVTATRIFPGMESLRADAIAKATYAQLLASDPALRRTVAAAYRGQPGVRDANGTVEIFAADGSTPLLKAGTPLWAPPAPTTGAAPKRQVVRPSVTDAATTVFRGVVARESESPRGKVPVVLSPPCVARVHGGAGGLTKGAAVGLAVGQDYLGPATDALTTVGLVAEAVPAGTTVLVELTPAGGGGGGGTMFFD